MKRELAKNPALANESWDRFLPKFKKYVVLKSSLLLHPARSSFFSLMFLILLCLVFLYLFRKNVKQKKVKAKEKKPYTPFPPPQQPSKVNEDFTCTYSVFSAPIFMLHQSVFDIWTPVPYLILYWRMNGASCHFHTILIYIGCKIWFLNPFLYVNNMT